MSTGIFNGTDMFEISLNEQPQKAGFLKEIPENSWFSLLFSV